MDETFEYYLAGMQELRKDVVGALKAKVKERSVIEQPRSHARPSPATRSKQR